MDCMMACLAECTELWPAAAMERCGDDPKDDIDVECNRDAWRERRPVEAWQAEQVADGGHENKSPCSVLPASSSKDPSGQVQCHARVCNVCERCPLYGVCCLARGGRDYSCAHGIALLHTDRELRSCPVLVFRKIPHLSRTTININIGISCSCVFRRLAIIRFFCRITHEVPGALKRRLCCALCVNST